MSDAVRLDKWLWAARFFKTRSLAAEAISGGKVHLNGVRVKPAKNVAVGDELRVRRGDEEFSITVRGLSQRRGPASVAVELYEESEASRLARETQREARRLHALANPLPTKKPSKKDRRQIVRFTRKSD